jgi:CsoR family transcriptional regulator, copper-sensing transcriptional repressor
MDRAMTTSSTPQTAGGSGASSPLRTRLRRVSGQVLRIDRMLGENRSCEDVLIQLAAVQGALRAAAQQVLACHLADALGAVGTGSLPAAAAAEEAAYLSGLLAGIPSPGSSPSPGPRET